MVIDHVGLLFFPEMAIFREIGRLAFPLFAFLLTEGVMRTSDTQKYISRLALFAVISQIPYTIMLYFADADPVELNIFFLLTLGVGMLAALRITKNIIVKTCIVVFIAAVAEVLNVSYGAYGMAIILACYWLRQNHILAGVSLFVTATVAITLIIPQFVWLQLFALLALPIMAAYNHKPGLKISRWWFYWFYPAHMAILSGLYFILSL